MNKNLILVRDDEDYEFIYGALLLIGNVFDTGLFQRRLRDMREKLGFEDYNGDDIVKAVLEEYKDDYKDIEYIFISNDELFV